MSRGSFRHSRISGDRHRQLAEMHLEAAERSGIIRAFFDGCTEPINPGGTAGAGAVMFKGAERIWEYSNYVEPSPTTSNNIAEYMAVNAVLDQLLWIGNNPKAVVFGDSRLVICQLWGWPEGARKWNIHGVDTNKPKGIYADMAVEARAKLKQLPKVKGHWIPRERNDVADDLSKAHLRRLGVEFRIQPEEAEDAA